MTISRVINGRTIEIELTSEEKQRIFMEGDRQTKIKESILLLHVLSNVDISKDKLTREQEDLLVTMSVSYHDSFYDYGPGFSWKSTYNTYRNQLLVLFPQFNNH